MIDAGNPVSAPPTEPAPPRWWRRRRAWLVAALAAVLVAGAAGFFVLGDDDSRYPSSWDPRIEPYVSIVEKERALRFDHPVRVRFLADAEFEKTVRADEKDLDEDERREIEQAESLFRALGLLAGDVDLFEAVNEASGTGTLAYYAFDDETITVRGATLTRASRGTLVHELTHALQDQQFDVGDRLKALGKKAEAGEPTTQTDALRALTEGDAERVADLYRTSLDPKERKAVEKAESADTAQAVKDYEKLPQVVVALLGAPYSLGQALAEAFAADDVAELDALFKDPPPDDSVLLDPLKAFDELEAPAEVDIPATEAGEKKIDSGQIGALATYLMLAERIPLHEALAAADAWAGDAFVAFTRDDVVCARVHYATVTTPAAVELVTAFEEWIAAVPGSTATIERRGNRLAFESCDPGEGTELTKDASTDALTLVATRGYLSSTLLRSGAPAPTARCFGQRVVDEYSVEQLQDPEFGADDPAVGARIRELVQGCE
jgi:hypothetical protein